MRDEEPAKPGPEPEQAEPKSVVSIAERNQELRHEAARRLAARHNASLRPPPTDAA